MNELGRWSDVFNDAKTILDFLEWAQNEQGLFLAEYEGDHPELLPMWRRRQDLIYAYFDIDPKKLEAGRRALIERLRALAPLPKP